MTSSGGLRCVYMQESWQKAEQAFLVISICLACCFACGAKTYADGVVEAEDNDPEDETWAIGCFTCVTTGRFWDWMTDWVRACIS